MACGCLRFRFSRRYAADHSSSTETWSAHAPGFVEAEASLMLKAEKQSQERKDYDCDITLVHALLQSHCNCTAVRVTEAELPCRCFPFLFNEAVHAVRDAKPHHTVNDPRRRPAWQLVTAGLKVAVLPRLDALDWTSSFSNYLYCLDPGRCALFSLQLQVCTTDF
jgi:hypothetical protein